MSDSVFETVKEWLAVSNPGLVTKEELQRLEGRVDELVEIVDEIEERLDAVEAEPVDDDDES